MLTMLTCYNFCFPVSTNYSCLYAPYSTSFQLSIPLIRLLYTCLRPLFIFLSAVYTAPYSSSVYLSTPNINFILNTCLRPLVIFFIRSLYIFFTPVYSLPVYAPGSLTLHLSTPLLNFLSTCLRPLFTSFTPAHAP